MPGPPTDSIQPPKELVSMLAKVFSCQTNSDNEANTLLWRLPVSLLLHLAKFFNLKPL